MTSKTNTAVLSSLPHDAAIALPNPGSTSVITPEPGAYTQFLFKMGEIQNVTTRSDGALVMSLKNNSTLVVSNFQDLVNSAESCGRDTILQFMADQQQGGITQTRIVNIAPEALAQVLDPTLANSNIVNVMEPKPGTTHEIVMTPGKTYRFDFDPALPAKTVDGTNLMLSFKNGGLVILRDYVPVMNGDLPPALTLADGTVINASKMLVAICEPAQTVVAAPKVANIEPAAGEPKPMRAKKIAVFDTPQEVANIEPAAGGANSPASGGRGGGFSSGIDLANLAGLARLGPLGATDFGRGLPRVADGITAGGTVAPVANLVVSPALVTDNAQVYEDNSVVLRVQTTAPAGTTTLVTISVFPSGWAIIDPRGGTFDLVTRTWSILVPNGQSFDGGPVIRPPANSDADIASLTVRAVLTDTTTGLITEFNQQISVVTDAVADLPALTASAADTQTASSLLTITTAPTDLDGSEQIFAVYVGPLPTGFTLSKGVLQNDGRYLLDPTDLSNVRINGSPNFGGMFNIDVTSVVREVNFSGEEFDLTNNEASRTVTIPVTFVAEGLPVIGDSLCEADESALNNTNVLIFQGNYDRNFGTDGPGAVTLDEFTSSGSRASGALSSLGVPITVTQDGMTYTGRAGSTTVFTLVVNPSNSTYEYRQFEPLDHADGNNPNDIISLNFGIKITDADGDIDRGVLQVTVADDAPISQNDQRSLTNGGVATGNVLTNDVGGQDIPSVVTQVVYNNVIFPITATNGTVTINAAFGTLVMQANGTYTYTAPSGSTGGDVFTYTLRDRDGDSATATLTVGVANGVPTINDTTETTFEFLAGPSDELILSSAFNYGSDGPGIIRQVPNSFSVVGSLRNGQFTSNGVPIIVTHNENNWTGMAGSVVVFTMVRDADGLYAFNLLQNFDHASAQNAVNSDSNREFIDLRFGLEIADVNGDKDTGIMTVRVGDDWVFATDDTVSVAPGSLGTGNVLTNDDSVENPIVLSVVFKGQTYNVAANTDTVIDGDHGTLTIQQDGDYTYRPYNAGTENFCLDPTQADVATANDPSITRNGITLTAIDPRNGQTLGDLSWVTGNLNLDNSWFQEMGVGVSGNGNNRINGVGEGVRISFDQPKSEVTVYVGGYNLFFDDNQETLRARVFLDGQSQPTTVNLVDVWNNQYDGYAAFNLTSSQFNNLNITSLEIFSPESTTAWTLRNVEYDRTTIGGTDAFTYTARDRDGDFDTGLLQATNSAAPPAQPVTANVLAFDDLVSQAVNDFVINTSMPDLLSPANDSGPIQTTLSMIAPMDDQSDPLVA